MIFNTKVFFIARPPSLIVWNCETHQQFELSIAYQHRLSELISTPESFDQTCSIDKDFLDAGVIKYPNDSEIEWGWDRLSEIFHSGTKCIPLESQPNDLADSTKQYSAHCKETLSKPPPIESFKKSSSNHITLPPPNRAISAGLVHVLKTRKTCRNYDSSPVHAMFQDHLEDEAKHALFFADLFKTIWHQSTPQQKHFFAIILPSILKIFSSGDSYWLIKALIEAGISLAAAETINDLLNNETSTNKRVSSGASMTFSVLRKVNFFSEPTYASLFLQAGLPYE
ncbi:MAG: hypothetical protein PW845_24455 [Pseudomonas sp.]|nr:hypothetical protein [Pseudomonas sp.]